MTASIIFSVCSFVYLIMIFAIYLSKAHIKNEENRIYLWLLITNFVGLVVEIASTIFKYKFPDMDIIFNVLLRFIMVYFVTWPFLFLLYIITVSKDRDIKMNVAIPFLTLECLLSFLLPLNVQYSNGVVAYTYGMSVIFTYIVGTCDILLCLYFLIRYHSVMGKKKMIPVILFLVLYTIAAIIAMNNPDLLIISSVETLITVLMYHTIENPDLKVITELNIAKDQAEKANRAKSDFLSSMSHEIRTPLNAIVGLSEDMKEKDECPESMKEDLEDVVSASRTLLEIVGNIMDISKIESDKMEIIEVPYNFKEEIESLARINAVRIGDKQLELKVNIAEDIPYELVGDRGHVKEIVNNLLSNAIKYTDKGTVNLTVKCINENDICNLMISVEDTGRGIKKENIEKLFTKFERLDVERNTTTEGTGLGLAITKKLVELMGGKINVESEFGKGSIFIVHIPQRIGSMTRPITDTQLINTSEIVKESRKKRVNYKTKSILIVDDNKLNIKVARRSLEQLNFKVIDECYNGKECVDKIKNNEKYDIILMDIMMPIMSGETALEELKKIEGFNTPVIALTADAVAGAEERYKEEGFDGYIAKPFNKDQIKVNLDSLFDNKKKVKELEEDIWKDAPTYIFTSSLAKDDVQNDEQQKEI